MSPIKRPLRYQNEVYSYHRDKQIDKSDRRLTSRTDGNIRHLSLTVRTPGFQSGNAGFKSRRCHQLRPLRPAVKTRDSQSRNAGSTLAGVTRYGSVIQLSRIPDCLSGGCGFKSRPSRHISIIAEKQMNPGRLYAFRGSFFI